MPTSAGMRLAFERLWRLQVLLFEGQISLQVAALRAHACAYHYDAADGGNPFAKGNTAAKAVADPYPGVRQAVAQLSPSFVHCSQRHSKILQPAVTTLLKLAGKLCSYTWLSSCLFQNSASFPQMISFMQA